MSQVSSSLMVAWIATTSLKLQSKSLPSLLTGFSVMDEIVHHFPLFNAMNLDLADLKLIIDKEISYSRLGRTHLPPGTDDVVTVKSSIKALMRGCWMPDLGRGHLHSFSAALTFMLMARVRRIHLEDSKELWAAGYYIGYSTRSWGGAGCGSSKHNLDFLPGGLSGRKWSTSSLEQARWLLHFWPNSCFMNPNGFPLPYCSAILSLQLPPIYSWWSPSLFLGIND